ncbi:MAG: alpha/beta hydrolase [Pseudomonadota bacterium]
MLWAPGENVWLTIGGVQLEARCWGPPPTDAPTLVLLHEGLGCVELWRDFPDRLAETTGFGVFSFSRQGYGRSDPCNLPRPIDYMECEADTVLRPVLDTAKIEKAVLIGHSDGASIAALYAGRSGDARVCGVGLIAPHFYVEDISIEAIRAARVAYETGDLKERLARYHVNVEAAFQGWNGAWLNPEFRDWDITGCLNAIKTPVLAIQGREDPYGTVAQVEVIADQMTAPATVHLLDQCGHAPHLEQADEALHLILEFIARL